jgi:hypothetical protein
MTPNFSSNVPDLGFTSFGSCLLQGCATAPGGNPSDPFESFNRSVFSFHGTRGSLGLLLLCTKWGCHVSLVTALSDELLFSAGNVLRVLVRGE